LKKLLTNHIKKIVGILVAVALIAWMIWSIDWLLVWKESKNANFIFLVPTTLILLGHYILRAWRWRYLLPNGNKYRIKSLFDAIMIGNLATFILPLRAGEFIRPLYLKREYPEQISFPVGFASVVVERFLDLLAVLVSLTIILPFIPKVPEWVMLGAYMLGVIAIGILVFILWAIFSPKSLLGIVSFFLFAFPENIKKSLLNLVNEAIKGSAVLKNTKNLTLSLILTLFIWLLNFYSVYVAFFMFNMEYSFLLATTLSVIIALAVAAPSAPGFVGIIQVATIATFSLFGQSKEIATSYAIITHILQYIIFCSYGFIILSIKGLKLSQFSRSKQSADF
jgi:uncharacterized protein (TIRG00374 family)